ncbi:MAG: transcriptional repressor [Opitutales bacterium]|nr:transcriptional repressor [Opitutales bacterium]
MKHGPGFLRRLLEHLEASPLRMTRKRERLLGVLAAADQAISAAVLRDRAGLPPSDLVTVYRTLEAFERVGILQRIPLEESGHLFELTEPHDHHHHFVCRECHRTERLDLCLGKELEARARKLGFTEVRHVMEVYGFCEACRPVPASVD